MSDEDLKAAWPLICAKWGIDPDATDNVIVVGPPTPLLDDPPEAD